MTSVPRSPSSHPDLSSLKSLEEQCAILLAQNNFNSAVNLLEQMLVLQHHIYGNQSLQMQETCKKLGNVYNQLSLKFLQEGNVKFAFELLKKAKVISEKDEELKAVTYNNFACYYRKIGNLQKAMRYLSFALRVENEMKDIVHNKADTHLNMCAVLSELGRHQNALDHAQSALLLLRHEIDSSRNSGHITLDRIAVLGIAYFNVGAEQEFLKNQVTSEKSYLSGLNATQGILEDSHSVVLRLKESLESLRRNK